MQLGFRARGSAVAPAATPRSRRASTRPPPIRAPRPSRRQSRRVTDSQFVWMSMAVLILEDELGRVDQGPEQVGDRLATAHTGGGEDPLGDGPLFLRRKPAVGKQVD